MSGVSRGDAELEMRENPDMPAKTAIELASSDDPSLPLISGPIIVRALMSVADPKRSRKPVFKRLPIF